ncbi:MAG: hypothetical protein WA431_07100 [Candidatus Cybelea sp.]
MTGALNSRVRMERATLASVGIHVLAALTIPALAWTTASTSPVETVSFAHILHVRITPTRPPQPPPRALAPRREPKATINFANHIRIVAAKPHARARKETTVASAAPAAPSYGAVLRAGARTSNSQAVPNASPSPAVRAVASVGAHQNGGYLPFGAEQPDPVLDPGVRKQLDALGAHVTLVITVGEDGRTESIAFDPPVDPQLESRIRSMLADADWDPAVCGGGVACQGQATIKL